MIKVSSPLLNFGCGSLRWSWSRERQRQQEFALKLERRAAATAGIWDEAGASAATTTGIFRWNWSRERQRPQRFALKLKQMATAATEIWDEAGARAAATTEICFEAEADGNSSNRNLRWSWSESSSNGRNLSWSFFEQQRLNWIGLRSRLFRWESSSLKGVAGSSRVEALQVWKLEGDFEKWWKLTFPLENEPIYTIAPLLRTRHVNFVDHGLALFAWHELACVLFTILWTWQQFYYARIVSRETAKNRNIQKNRNVQIPIFYSPIIPVYISINES